MNRRNLPFNALRAFEAAARHSSVSGAAGELGVTHSAVSHQIRQLENQLDVILFERTNRGLIISEEGSRLLPVLVETFDRISSVLSEFDQTEEQPAIQISCTPTFATRWLVPRLTDWYSRPNACRIHLIPTLEIMEVSHERIDLAIRCGIPPWPDLRHELLMPIHLVPVCSPQYAQKSGLPDSMEAIFEYDLIHADVGDHGQGQEWKDWLEGAGIEKPINLAGVSFHDPSLAMQAAADGLGCAIGYHELIEKDLHSGQLLCLSEKRVKHAFSYYLVYPGEREEDEKIAEFKTWLIQQSSLK
ncbi:MAG: LysR substrate-binding domain-containing protein [Pseudomonadota bacterium]